MYTGAFIAEVVRSGIQAVVKGQREAARSIGLKEGQALRLIVLPQAVPIIVPPLTSQYLNLAKNSSLAVAIAFPDLFQRREYHDESDGTIHPCFCDGYGKLSGYEFDNIGSHELVQPSDYSNWSMTAEMYRKLSSLRQI